MAPVVLYGKCHVQVEGCVAAWLQGGLDLLYECVCVRACLRVCARVYITYHVRGYSMQQLNYLYRQ